jgi:hypothetical protein
VQSFDQGEKLVLPPSPDAFRINEKKREHCSRAYGFAD